MSSSYQNRNVLFSSFRFYGFASFMFMNTKLEIPPPGVIGWRSRSSSHLHNRRRFLLSYRPFRYLFESQRSTFVVDAE